MRYIQEQITIHGGRFIWLLPCGSLILRLLTDLIQVSILQSLLTQALFKGTWTMRQRYIDLHLIVANDVIKLCALWACFVGMLMSWFLIDAHTFVNGGKHWPALSYPIQMTNHTDFTFVSSISRSACSRDTHCIVRWNYMPSIYNLALFYV